jgi:uncharacterized protein YqgC (DUF456 family)
MLMDWLGWIIIVILMALGMAGAVYAILPGALAIYGAFFVYGLFFSFNPFGLWFWLIQTLIVAAIFAADYAASVWGVQKLGGSRASIIGSVIGLIIGPFVIPVAGIILGPILGAVAGEMLQGSNIKQAFKSGIGSAVGLFSSIIIKIILQTAMILIFIFWLIWNT